jgi:DNA topoisomerase-1
VQCGEKSASLLKAQSTEELTLADALQLLTLPRTVGVAPDGEEVVARAGRYGPYLTKGEDTRSLDSEEKLFTVTLDEALELFAQPKARGRRTAAATAPLRELGADPLTEKPLVIKDGRFGPYVTDGETNASLRRGDSIEEVTLERASELLAERRAKGPAKPRKKAAAGTKKATKSAAKKTATKTAAKKSSTPKKAAAKKSTD